MLNEEFTLIMAHSVSQSNDERCVAGESCHSIDHTTSVTLLQKLNTFYGCIIIKAQYYL